MNTDLVLERVNKGKCPICNEKLDEPIVFVKYKDSKQPVHKRHIKGEK